MSSQPSSHPIDILNELFTSNEVFKKNKQYYLDLINDFDSKTIKNTIRVIKFCVNPTEKSISDLVKMKAYLFLQEAMNLNVSDFVEAVKEEILPILIETAKLDWSYKLSFKVGRMNENDPNRINPNFTAILLECIRKWSIWYYKDPTFVQAYDNLNNIGILFPSQEVYFKNFDDNPRTPLLKNDNLKDNSLDEFLQFSDQIKKLKVELFKLAENYLIKKTKEIKDLIWKKVITLHSLKDRCHSLYTNNLRSNFLSLADQIYLQDTYNTLNNFLPLFERTDPEEYHKFLISFKPFLQEELKETEESPIYNNLEISPNLPNQRLNVSISHKKTLLKLKTVEMDGESQLKFNLFLNQETFDQAKEKFLNELMKNPFENATYNFVLTANILSDSYETYQIRFFALRWIKHCSESKNKFFMAAIAKEILSKIEDIILNWKEAVDLAESEREYFNGFFLLAKECIMCWAQLFPINPKYPENPSSFAKSYEKLVKNGVRFPKKPIFFNFLTGKDLEDIFKDYDNMINSFKNYLASSMSKNKTFLDSFKSEIKNIENCILKIDEDAFPDFQVKIKETSFFFEELNTRIELLEKGKITLGNFRTKFRKFFGLSTNQNNSDISTLSHIDNSDKTQFSVINSVMNIDCIENLSKIPEKDCTNIEICQNDYDIILETFQKNDEKSNNNMQNRLSCEKIVLCIRKLIVEPLKFDVKFNALFFLKEKLTENNKDYYFFIENLLLRTLATFVFTFNNLKIEQIEKAEFLNLVKECLFIWGMSDKFGDYGHFRKALDVIKNNGNLLIKNFKYFKDSEVINGRKNYLQTYLYIDSGNSKNLKISYIIEDFLKNVEELKNISSEDAIFKESLEKIRNEFLINKLSEIEMSEKVKSLFEDNKTLSFKNVYLLKNEYRIPLKILKSNKSERVTIFGPKLNKDRYASEYFLIAENMRLKSELNEKDKEIHGLQSKMKTISN